jgi:transcription elongation factor Elf1
MSPGEPQLGFQCPECGKFSVVTSYDRTIFRSKKDVYKLKCLSCHWCYVLTTETNKRTPAHRASSLPFSA